MEGNERADSHAKEARNKEPEPQRITYLGIAQRDKKKRKTARNHEGYGRGKIVDLARKQATIYTYLRTNRGPFNLGSIK